MKLWAYFVYAGMALSGAVNILAGISASNLRAENERLTAAYAISVDTNKTCDAVLTTCVSWQARVRWILEERCFAKKPSLELDDE